MRPCVIIYLFQWNREKNNRRCRRRAARKEGIIMKKFCTKCGREFDAIGREVICPACKQAAAEETKRAAVLRAKKASWTGESVPVRISGRASTVIRSYGKANNLPFAAALDDLLKASDYFKGVGQKWEDVEPYKSRRRGKQAEESPSKPQEVKTAQDGTQTAQAAKVASKATSTAKKPVKTSTAAGKKGEKKA